MKSEVRAKADELDLPNRARRDSQGICFLGKIRFDEFVEHHHGQRRGEILEIGTARKLGEHRGYWFHTVGQRRGRGRAGGPGYVAGKDVERNVVWGAHGDRLSERSRSGFDVAAPHWIAGPPRRGALELKLRHSAHVYRCRVTGLDDLERDSARLHVELEGADSGVARGQFAVFYDGDECLGAASIEG